MMGGVSDKPLPPNVEKQQTSATSYTMWMCRQQNVLVTSTSYGEQPPLPPHNHHQQPMPHTERQQVYFRHPSPPSLPSPHSPASPPTPASPPSPPSPSSSPSQQQQQQTLEQRWPNQDLRQRISRNGYHISRQLMEINKLKYKLSAERRQNRYLKNQLHIVTSQYEKLKAFNKSKVNVIYV